jgi:2-aminobenzoate-CoA ligase
LPFVPIRQTTSCSSGGLFALAVALQRRYLLGSRFFANSRPAGTGMPVKGCEAKIVDESMNEVARGMVGSLAVRGPTGCRYLADQRQKNYVRDYWNLTGDSFWQEDEGYFRFAARSDDMIISAGNNIAGPEVRLRCCRTPRSSNAQ